MDPLSFAVHARDGAARAGCLHTPHGELPTPAFFPVGTYGAVRGLTPDDLRAVGVRGVLTNTYHLHLRPGEDAVQRLGGVHGFMGWDGPMLTDSGGYQVFSLQDLCRVGEDGVEFRDPSDGARHFLSPESCIAIQEKLGADLIVVLDEFEPLSASGDNDPRRARECAERTLRWAARCRAAHTRPDQKLFGIVQGGADPDLRAECAQRVVELGFDAFAIGGLGVGEGPSARNDLIEATLRALPADAPRYLMGLGTPTDLVDAVARGVDVFDCVIPTRHGRHGAAFTSRGRLNLRNARFRADDSPLDPDCGCPVCAHWPRSVLRHLIASGEVLAARLVSQHNLAYYMRLMRDMRAAIEAGRFAAWRDDLPQGPDGPDTPDEPAS